MNRFLAIIAILAITQISGAASLQQPFVFERNDGQFHEDVLYAARGAQAVIWLEQQGLTLQLNGQGEAGGDVLRLHWAGSRSTAELTGVESQTGRVNYLKGRDENKWIGGIETFAKVRYQEIYPGIDAIVYSRDGQAEYDFLLAPGANPGLIRLEFTGASGEPMSLAITAEGDLSVALPGGEFRQRAPVAFQQTPSGEIRVPARFVLIEPHIAGIEVTGVDPSLPLRIDPVISYGTYLGGSSGEYGGVVRVADNGLIYVLGNTQSTDFYTTRALQPTGDTDYDIFITQFTPDGQNVIFSTYLGGSLEDSVESLVIHPEGLFISGYSISTDFPGTAQGFQPDLAGDYDIIVAHLSLDGQQLFNATYLGGAIGYDNAPGLAVDDDLNIYIAGVTQSSDFPTSNPLPSMGTFRGGSSDAYVAVFSAAGRGLMFCSLLGGGNSDQAFDLALDANGRIFVAGSTSSNTDFPLITPIQAIYGGGFSDGFVSVINPVSAQLIYSSFLGGDQSDSAQQIKLDSNNRPVIVGQSSSGNFPEQNPLPGLSGGLNNDVFITVMNSNLSAIDFSTRIGGTNTENVRSAALDSAGNVFIAGQTFSNDLPTSNPIFPAPTNFFTIFAMKVNFIQPRLIYSTYLGGTQNETVTCITTDPAGNAWLAGGTTSTDFPVFKAWQPELNGGTSQDIFVVRLQELPALPIFAPPRVVRSIYFDIDNDGSVAQGDPLTLIFDRPVAINPHLLGSGSVFLPVENDTLGGAGAGSVVLQSQSTLSSAGGSEGIIGLPTEPTFEVNPLNQRQVIIHLGESPILEPGGDFNPAQITAGSSSGIDIAAGLLPTAIASIYGVPALKNPDAGAVDMRWNFRQEGYFIDQPSSDTLILPPNTANSAYSRHRLIFPPLSIDNTQVLLRPTNKDERVTNAMEIDITGQTTFDPPATLRLQYLDAEIDIDAGQRELGMRINQLVTMPDNSTQWVQVPGVQTVDRVNKWVEVQISNLTPAGQSPASRDRQTAQLGASQIGIFGNIPGETIESASIFIKPAASEVATFLNETTLKSGTSGFYTKHVIEFPGYATTTANDPAGIKITVRKPGLFDVIPSDGGQEWPIESAAFLIVQSADSSGAPVPFTDPVILTVQFFDGTTGSFNDVWGFDNQPGDPQGMRLAGDVFDGFGVDCQFDTGAINEVTLTTGGGTTRASGVTNLTGSDGVGLWGVVAGDPVITVRHGWMLK